MKRIKSPITYMGNKFRIIEKLFDSFPWKICHFYDLFGGSGVVALNAASIAKKVVYNEINTHVFKLFKLVYLDYENNSKLIEHITNLITKWDLFFIKAKDGKIQKQSLELETNYNKFRNHFNQNNMTNYTELYTLHLFAHNSLMRFNSKGQLNSSVGYCRPPNWQFNLCDLKKVKERKNIYLSSFDFEKVFNIDKIIANDFIYVDPPYLATTPNYKASWNIKDELRLYKFLEQLNKKGAKWALSNVLTNRGQKNEELIIWSRKWFVQKIDINYIPFGIKNKFDDTEEVLITNYDPKIYHKQLRMEF